MNDLLTETHILGCKFIFSETICMKICSLFHVVFFKKNKRPKKS